MNFKQSINTVYPPNNFQIFEEWFSDHFVETAKDRVYLDIWWTSFYVNHNYGKDLNANRELQNYIDSLDKTKKHFTVLQYDDGILNDISGLDIKVFGSGGGRIDFPIPLITMPHPYTFDVRRDTFASFAGSMTHSIRRQMMAFYRHRYKLNKTNIGIRDYCEQMARSVFALCPRGYGESSFRICEALQYGAIPIYISDKFIIPGNIDFNEYGVLVHSSELRQLDKILKGFSADEIRSKQEAGRDIYKRVYTFEGCKKLILDNL